MNKVAEADLPEVLGLANSMVLNTQERDEEAERQGFLVSGFSLSDYQRFLGEAEHFYIAREGDQIAGFLLAYNSEAIKSSEQVNTQIKDALADPFVLIKQICVDASIATRGIATSLYHHLFEIEQARGFAAAIVTDPYNERSVKFHERRGFHHFLDPIAPPDADGIVRPRGVWYRGPAA